MKEKEKFDKFNKNAEEIRKSLYNQGIDISAHYCMDFAVGLAEAIQPHKIHTIRCSWLNEDMDLYSHCGFIWNDHFCDGTGCTPLSKEQEIRDKMYEYLFGVTEDKSKWKAYIKESTPAELKEFLDPEVDKEITQTVREFLL